MPELTLEEKVEILWRSHVRVHEHFKKEKEALDARRLADRKQWHWEYDREDLMREIASPKVLEPETAPETTVGASPEGRKETPE